MVLTCICGGVQGQMFRIPLFSDDVNFWNKGVLGIALLMSTIGWRILMLAGVYLEYKNLAI